MLLHFYLKFNRVAKLKMDLHCHDEALEDQAVHQLDLLRGLQWSSVEEGFSGRRPLLVTGHLLIGFLESDCQAGWGVHLETLRRRVSGESLLRLPKSLEPSIARPSRYWY